jgi:hypothetical protein
MMAGEGNFDVEGMEMDEETLLLIEGRTKVRRSPWSDLSLFRLLLHAKLVCVTAANHGFGLHRNSKACEVYCT